MYKICTFAAERDKQPPFCSIMTADYYIIKLERFNQGLTQADLAKKAKISLSSVIKAERGGSISPRTNLAIHKALGLK